MLLLIGHTESTAIEPAFHDQPRKGKDALFAALKTKNGLRRSGCRVDWGVQETTHHGIFNVLICKPGEAMASKWRGSAVEGAVEWTRRRRLGSPFTNLRSYSFAYQAKQCGWGCSEIDMAATWIFQRKFVPYPYYIRTISPYLYDILTISVRYPKRTSAVRPYGVRTASVRRLYGIFTASLRHLYGI